MNISQQEYNELKERAMGNGQIIATLMAYMVTSGIINKEIIELTKASSHFTANYYGQDGANLQIEDVFIRLAAIIDSSVPS